MRPLAGVVVAAAALVAAGCGGHAKRAAITSYVDRINVVERQLARPFTEVSTANRSFAKAKKQSPQLAKKLAASERTMRTLARRLAAIPAPREAARLRTLLLELVRRQVALTHEVDQLYTFVPAFRTTLAPLGPADAGLTKELHKTASTTAAAKALDVEKADALERYSTTVAGVVAKVEQLQPPPVWQPGYTAQLASLRQLHAIALELADAIRANRAAALPALLNRFDRAAVATRTTAAQRSQRAAVVAYNARINSLVTLSRKINAEEQRLQRLYG
jgi:hypothetical protein